MTTLRTLLVAVLLSTSLTASASTIGDNDNTSKEVVNTLNNKLQVSVNGMFVTVDSVEKYSGVKIKLFVADTMEHITTKKSSNEFDFTQLGAGVYTFEVEGFAPTTIEVK
ncbi:hypothetical protein [Aquimarina algiphila]|uniref:T9SS type A sorting domain-containing protein n=1 Tax=Aquimarina algiphila TaxID=2047982 RepID=A0A554VRP4_9FLAO|nr:hypothetical protein [Aquimarina algiphila]TSE11320.1 hypothetical protein FOF46_01435 [Aquimarina algiphila]